MRIKNTRNDIVVADHGWVADSFWQRLKGLLGTKILEVGHGLVIKPCSSVHTFGMAYPIDVLFVAGDDRIIKIIDGMKAGQVAMGLGSRYVIELPIGTVERTMCLVGDRLTFE